MVGGWRNALLLVLLPVVAAGSLRFKSSGDVASLKLLQLTDLHFGERQADSRTLEIIHGALAAEQPDAVMFSGDMVSGYAFPAHNLAGRAARWLDRSLHTRSWWEQQWMALTQPLRQAGVPWASCLGNHDGEADLGRFEIAQLDAATGGGLSLTRPGPRHLGGGGNYWVDVLEPNGTRVAARIWMVDSGNRGCGRLAYGWGCVSGDTVAWVRRQAAALPRVPSLAFIHIPLPQFPAAWNRGASVNGSRQEAVGCPGMDTGMFEAAREFGINAIYSGHDHNNDFCGSLEGVRLCYGRKSGYGGYGPAHGMLHGARVIELRLGQDTADSPTWIWQEGGPRQLQAPAQAPREQQQVCSLDESACDRALGAGLCLRLRGWRNATVSLAAAAAALALAVATAGAAVAVTRRAQQHWQHRRGWEQVATAEKPDTLGV